MRPLLWLAGLLVGALGADAADAPAITLTVDCPACGPGQALPHDCPRGATAPSLAAPDPLPGLLASTRELHRRFTALENFTLPALGEPRSLAELDRTLTTLLAAARTAVARTEREQADLARGAEAATAEAQRLATRVTNLTSAMARARNQLSALPPQINAAHAAAVAARDEFLAWQKAHTALREQIRQARNRLFPRLHHAVQRGWILPPSAYRELPSPLAPKSARAASERTSALSQLAPEQPVDRRGTTPRIAGPAPLLLPTGGRSLDAHVVETDIRAKLNELAAVHYHAYAAAAVRAEAQRAGTAAQDATAVHTRQLAALEPAHDFLVAQLTAREAQLRQTQHVAATELTRSRDSRQRALTAWIETGVYRFLDQQADAALTPLLARGPDAAQLRALRLLAETTAQLGAAPEATLARLPATLAARGETLAGIQRELTALRALPELAFTASRADLPAVLQPYWPETRP